MRIRPLIWKLAAVWQEEGPAGIALRIRRCMQRSSAPDPFDMMHGTETSIQVDPWNFFDVHSENLRTAVKYQAVDPNVLRLALSLLPSEAFQLPFIDLGCGKGRALIVAHEAGYRKLIGLDFSASLLETAKLNLAQCGIAADLRCMDADDFQFPPEPSLVYLYNPFGRVLLSCIANRIPSMSYIIYANPRHRSCLTNFMPIADGPRLFVGQLVELPQQVQVSSIEANNKQIDS